MSLTNRLSGFRRSTDANVATIFGLMSVILIGALGSAVDVNASVKAKKEIQAVLDSAVVEGVKHGDTLGDAYALDLFAARMAEYDDFNFRYTIGASTYDSATKELCVPLTGTLDTVFLTIFGMSEIDVSVQSCSSLRTSSEAACFLAMHTTEKHTLELHDVIEVNAPGCHIYGNSDHHDDVIDPHQVGSFVKVVGGLDGDGSVQTVGGGHHFLENVENLSLGSEMIANPFPAGNIPAWPTPISATLCSISSISPYPTNCTASDPSLNTRTYNIPVNLSGGSAVSPTSGTITFNNGIYMDRGGLIQFDVGTTIVSQVLSAGTIVVRNGATLDVRAAEIHADQIVIEGGGVLLSNNSIIFLHGSGGSIGGCNNGRGSTCEIEVRSGGTLRLSGIEQPTLPHSTTFPGDWRGFAIYSAHTPDVYNFGKDFEFYEATIDIEGCVVAPENFIFWYHEGDHNGLMQHSWTCWLISGVNWRGSGAGPNVIRMNFNINVTGAVPYPAVGMSLVPGSDNGAVIIR